MPVLLFVIMFAFSAFAADVAGGSNATGEADGFVVRTGALFSLLVSAQSGSFNADSVMAAEASGEKSNEKSGKSSDESSDDETCDGEDCDDEDDEDCEGEDCDESSGSAEESEEELDSAAIAIRRVRSIPLPRQTAYTGKGLSIGLGGGVYNPTEDCDCMGVWQGQLEYFYTDWISGGIDVRFFGGDLDSDVMVMYQRYRANFRMHKAWEKLDIYLESVLGFESTSISELRDQIKRRGKFSSTTVTTESDMPDWVSHITGDTVVVIDSTEVPKDEACERMLSLDGFSVGLGTGFGVNLTRLWGLTGSVLFEYNFSKVMQLSLVPGVAFNLREVWGWANRNLFSAWIMAEFGAQRYFNNGGDKWSNYGLLGLQLGI